MADEQARVDRLLAAIRVLDTTDTGTASDPADTLEPLAEALQLTGELIRIRIDLDRGRTGTLAERLDLVEAGVGDLRVRLRRRLEAEAARP